MALVDPSKFRPLQRRIKYLSDELDLNHMSIEETNMANYSKTHSPSARVQKAYRANLRDITDKANSRFNFTLNEHKLDMTEDISHNGDNSDSFSYDLYAALSMIKTFQKKVALTMEYPLHPGFISV